RELRELLKGCRQDERRSVTISDRQFTYSGIRMNQEEHSGQNGLEVTRRAIVNCGRTEWMRPTPSLKLSVPLSARSEKLRRCHRCNWRMSPICIALILPISSAGRGISVC